jgi:hypothetical protein
MNKLHEIADETHDCKTNCHCLADLKEFYG